MTRHYVQSIGNLKIIYQLVKFGFISVINIVKLVHLRGAFPIRP